MWHKQEMWHEQEMWQEQEQSSSHQNIFGTKAVQPRATDQWATPMVRADAAEKCRTQSSLWSIVGSRLRWPWGYQYCYISKACMESQALRCIVSPAGHHASFGECSAPCFWCSWRDFTDRHWTITDRSAVTAVPTGVTLLAREYLCWNSIVH